jgi:hypothetical protein
MQIAHLAHGDTGIRCTKCGQHFEVRSWFLADPVRLVELKEGLAAKHTCRTARVVPMLSTVRVWRNPASEPASAYFSNEVRRYLPA